MATAVGAGAAVVLASWSGQSVRVPDVLAALEDIRRSEPLPSTRTSVLTLVLLADRAEEAARAGAALHELGGRHPARAITVRTEEGEPGLDAEVRLMGAEVAGTSLWFEDVCLTVRGPAGDHLDSLLEPFTLAELPMVAWFVDRLPDPDDPVLRAADAVLVDARDLGEVECLATLADVASSSVLLDLSWVRLRPWREQLAALFDGPALRPFLDGVRSIEVSGKTGPSHLLAGWLSSRLGTPGRFVHLVEAEHVGVHIVAEHEGRTGHFEVARPGGERTVRASVAIEAGPRSDSVVVLPEASPAWGVAEALSDLGRDPIYEQSLDAALSIAARSHP